MMRANLHVKIWNTTFAVSVFYVPCRCHRYKCVWRGSFFYRSPICCFTIAILLYWLHNILFYSKHHLDNPLQLSGHFSMSLCPTWPPATILDFWTLKASPSMKAPPKNQTSYLLS